MVNIELVRFFEFDAAHNMPDYDGQCKNIHGHTYKLEVYVKTIKALDKSNPFVMDTKVLKRIVNENVIDKLDHRYINDVINVPTMENIAIWTASMISKPLQEYDVVISKIRLWETSRNSVVLTF